MRVHLLAFATAADAVGGHEREVEIPAGSRLQDLTARLRREHPALVELWPRLAVAVDGELAAPEHELTDGAEVALLPPVSGGESCVALVDEPLDVDAVRRAVAATGCGAAVLFVGSVRDRHAGRAVVGLSYTAYRPMARARLARIVGELEAATPGLQLAIHHRLGDLAVGEASVAIAAASPHRAAAFDAAREALERLKREVPIWKRERYADGGSAWREEEALGEARRTGATARA